MNWLTATVGIIFLVCIIVGIYKGAIKIAVSILATVITLVLVFFLTPYVSRAVYSTPLGSMVEDQVTTTISNVASSMIGGGDGTAAGGLTADNVRSALAAAGISEEELAAAGISVDDIVNGNISSADLSQYGISSGILDGLKAGGEQTTNILEGTEISKDTQNAAIESADIPDVFKNLLLANNNNDSYEELGADGFVQYVAKYLTKLIINVAAFLMTFLLITIILRAIIFALDIVSELPVLGLVNRLAGGVIGILGALFIVWFIFVVVTMLYTTSMGKEVYALIQGNDILKMIYEYNPIMKLATYFK